jgi:MoaA/NifB/PqqE/SkfB family radical SAM enzyme
VPGRLDANVVLSWIEELDAAGCFGVGFGGGEPTAHPEFAGICAEATKSTRLAVTFTTHGHRMDEGLANVLRGNVHFIRVSMDGVGRTYERLRGRPFEAFQRHLEIVATVAPFGLNVVVNDETVGELEAIASFAKSAGAVELLLLPEQAIRDRLGISESTSRRLREWVLGGTPGVRLAMSRAGVTEGMPLADPFPEDAPLEGHAHIDARGILRAHAFASEGVPVSSSIMQSLEQLRVRRAE